MAAAGTARVVFVGRESKLKEFEAAGGTVKKLSLLFIRNKTADVPPPSGRS